MWKTGLPVISTRPGDEVFILGQTSGILGGSAYWAEVCDFVGGDPPAVDLDAELRLQRFLVAAAQRGLLRSAHDCSEGGLAVTLAEAVIGGPYVPGSLGCRTRPDRLRPGAAHGRSACSARTAPGRSFHVPRLLPGHSSRWRMSTGCRSSEPGWSRALEPWNSKWGPTCSPGAPKHCDGSTTKRSPGECSMPTWTARRENSMCGIIGVSALPDAARLAYLGLYALQHRGQESAGIVAIDREGMARSHRGMGLVSENFDDQTLAGLPGDVAVGHTRYSTTGSTVLANAQPCSVNTRCGPLAIAHNGNLINADAIKRDLVERGAIFTSSSDTEVLVHLIARSEEDTVDDQIREALEQVDGAYSLIITVGRTMYAAVDSRGFRPLVIGRLGTGIVVASESCALDLIGATFHCELRPGDFVRVDNGQVTHLPRLAPRPVSRCVFELVYFARPDSTVFGESVDRVRRELGRQLAREQPAPDGEVVFSVPDSSNAMALGFSEVSGIKLEYGLIRNHYVGRTFINPRRRSGWPRSRSSSTRCGK